ncbi:MAG: caspase family protein [Bacteroidota bacterium]
MKTKILYSLIIFLSFQNIIAQKLSIQTGHSAGITDLVFSPDGNFLASSGEDSKIVLWDMISSKQMNIFSGHTKTVNSLAVHPTKNIIASASDDNSVKLWEYPSGKLIKSYFFFEHSVKSVAFNPEGTKLACGSEYVYIIDLKSHDYKSIGKLSRKGYNAINYSNNGKYLAFGGKKNAVLYFYNIEKEKVTRKTRVRANDIIFDEESKHAYIAGQRGNIKRIPLNLALVKRKFNISSNSWFSFNSIVLNDEYFIAANQDNYIYVYDRNSGAREEILNAHSDEVTAIAINPKGRFLASAGKDRKILIWDLKKFALIKSMEGGANRVNSISFSKNGKLMFIGYNDGNFRLWNLNQKGKVLFQDHKKLNPFERYLRYKYSIDETSELINTDQILVKASLNQKDKFSDIYKSKEALIIWKLNKGKEMYTLKSKHSSDMQSFILRDSSEVLLLKSKGTHSQKYSFLDRKRIRDREEIFETSVYPYNISSIKKDKKLRLNTFNRKKLIKIKGDLYFKALSHSGNLLLALTYLKGGNTECQLWDLDNEEQINSFVLEDNYISGGFSQNGKYFYLTSTEGQIIKLYDANTFKEVSQFKGNAPVSFSSDNKLISFTDSRRNISLINIKEKKKIFKSKTGHSSIISDLKFNEHYKYIATSSHDGLIKFWDIKTGDLLVSLAAFDENDFIYITADNYYYSTKGAMDYIGFIENERLYTFEQFDVKFNRPDIVFSKLSYSTSDEIEAYEKAYRKRVQKMGFANTDLSGKINLPEIKFLNTDEFPISTIQNKITIDVSAKDSVEDIDRINIWVNDVPLLGTNGFSVKDKKSKNITKSFPVELSAGRNKIQVSATNVRGFESLKETFSIIYDIEETKPDLYLIAIGVSEYHNNMYNLDFAAKDAEDISSLFKDENSGFENVHSIKVLNKNATVENVLKLKSQLNNSKVDDVVVLFFAGHGMLDPEMDYYLATTEVDVNDMPNSALRYDYLEGLFDGIPARKKVIIIDACHSGEVDKDEEFTDTDMEITDENVVLRNIQSANALVTETKITTQSSFELMKMMFADIRRGTGSTVISSAGGGEFAYETEENKNGVFTYVLLNGIISKKADLNKDGDIMISELRDYVSFTVSRLTKGYQNPTYRRENLEFDFKIW